MTFREMLTEDLDQVMEIETDLFAMPWTKEGMFTFLTREDTMFFVVEEKNRILGYCSCLLYTSPSPRDQRGSRMPSSA